MILNFKRLEENYFEIVETSGDHHDYARHYLGERASFPVHTKKYGFKVGKDIDLILLGRIDFSEFIDKFACFWVKLVMGIALKRSILLLINF